MKESDFRLKQRSNESRLMTNKESYRKKGTGGSVRLLEYALQERIH